MASVLVLCGKCQRHVFETEQSCPFCSSSWTGRLVAAAALTATVALAGCAAQSVSTQPPSPSPSTPSPNTVPVVDSPAPATSPAAAAEPTSTTPPQSSPAQPATSVDSASSNAAGAYGPPPAARDPGMATAYGPPPGATPPGTSSDPWVQVSKVQVDGPMAMQDVLRVVRQQTSRLRSCYQVGLRERADKTAWTATVVFRISEAGKVMGPLVEGPDVPGPETKACLAAVTESMLFPPPPRGSALVNARFEVTYAPAPQKPPPLHP